MSEKEVRHFYNMIIGGEVYLVKEESDPATWPLDRLMKFEEVYSIESGGAPRPTKDGTPPKIPIRLVRYGHGAFLNMRAILRVLPLEEGDPMIEQLDILSGRKKPPMIQPVAAGGLVGPNGQPIPR